MFSSASQPQINQCPQNSLLMKLLSVGDALFFIHQKIIPEKKMPVCQVFRITNAFMNQSVIIKKQNGHSFT